MIQINLLPDVKLEYLRIRRQRNLVTMACFVVSGLSILIFVSFILTTLVIQKSTIKSTQKSIDKNLSSLKSIDDLEKILTIQNQITTLDTLHADKPLVSRLFTYSGTDKVYGYLSLLVPSTIRISTYQLSTSSDKPTMSFKGTADRVDEINQFVDTLKFTDFKETGSDKTSRVFSSVVLESYSVGSKNVAYTISLVYDPLIFSSENSYELLVPTDKQTTRSITERPTFVEQEPASTTTGSQQ